MRRVLFVNTATNAWLGADTWIHVQVMRHLDRRAHELYAACARGTRASPTPTYEALHDIPDLHLTTVDFGPDVSGRSKWGRLIAGIRSLTLLLGIVRLTLLVRRERIDIIHTSDRPRDALACVFLSRLTGRPCVIHVHVTYNPWMTRLLRWSLRRADHLVAVSEFVGASLVANGIPPERVHVVLNGIDVDRWQPGRRRDETRQELGIGAETPVLLTVCRLFPEKGVAEAIQALAIVRRELPDAQLLVVGTDVTPGNWFSAQLRELVDELGLGSAVRFLGLRDDVEGLFAAADVFVLPSFEEPFGLVFVEAMAMGLPVVALDNGGTREVVEHERNGLLVTRGDLDGLAASMLQLLRESEQRESMGRTGGRDARERFTVQRMAADVGAVYESIASTARHTGSAAATRGRIGMRVLEGLDVDQFRQALDEDGYVVIRDVVSKARLSELNRDLLDEFNRARSDGELFEGGGFLSGHLNCFPGEQSRFVWDEISEYGVVDLVRQVRPDIVDSVRATLNFNLPGSVAQHYHMDGLYLKEFLICNIAVVDTDTVNGALDVLPGTNREFYKFWRYALERKYKLTTRVPLAQGDVVVRKSTQWHRGMPNNSATPRPMMAITFGEMGKDELEADPFMVNDGKVVFYPNWYKTSRLGQLRERVFVAAPITYSAWRFARSLYGNKGYASF